MVKATMIMAPLKRPDAPKPAMARPTMRATELGAAPQIADPTSKMSSAPKKTHLIFRHEYSLPKKS
jgi:hypothetical protein